MRSDFSLVATVAHGVIGSMSDSPQEPRRGVVIVVLRGDRFLVIRRSQHVRAPGTHCFPGGHIEPGESEPAAVCRELLEELSIAATPVRLLWRSVTPWNVELAWWLAEIDPEANPQPNPQEVEVCDWLSVEAIRRLPNLLTSNLDFLDAWESGAIARIAEPISRRDSAD